MTKAEAPNLFILPLLPVQTPHQVVHCCVTKKVERIVGLNLAYRFLSGVLLRDASAAKICKSMNFSKSNVFFFLHRGPQACVPVIPAAADAVSRA